MEAGQDPSSVRAPSAVPLLGPSKNARGQHRRQGPRSSFPLYPGDHTSSWTSAISFSSVQSLCRVQLFATPWTEACKASFSITNSQSLLKLLYIKLVMPSNISSSVVPFSCCLQSFPASGSFQMSQLFASGGQSIGVSASASVFPINIQD